MNHLRVLLRSGSRVVAVGGGNGALTHGRHVGMGSLSSRRMMSSGASENHLRDKTLQMESVRIILMQNSWSSASLDVAGDELDGEDLMYWYRKHYAQHGKGEGEAARELYFAAERLHETLYCFDAAKKLIAAMTYLKNDIARETGIFGLYTGASERIFTQYKGIYDAFEKLMMTVPKTDSLLYRKCKSEINLHWATCAGKLHMPGQSFALGVVSWTDTYMTHERQPNT